MDASYILPHFLGYCGNRTGICQPIVYTPTTTLCRAAVAPCDSPEYCNGSLSCPPDLWYSAGTSCNSSNTCTPITNCTATGVCTGPDVLCVGICGDGIQANSEECDLGANNGVFGYCCSRACKYSTSQVPCRLANGLCDATEYCSGKRKFR